jgi:hypothetical protein
MFNFWKIKTAGNLEWIVSSVGNFQIVLRNFRQEFLWPMPVRVLGWQTGHTHTESGARAPKVNRKRLEWPSYNFPCPTTTTTRKINRNKKKTHLTSGMRGVTQSGGGGGTAYSVCQLSWFQIQVCVCNNNEQLTSSKRNKTTPKNGLGCWKMFFQTKRQNNSFSQKQILSSRFIYLFFQKSKWRHF